MGDAGELRRSPIEHRGRVPAFDLLDEARSFYTALHWGESVNGEFTAWGAHLPAVCTQIGTFEWAELRPGRRVYPEVPGSVLLLTDPHGEELYLASRSPNGVFNDVEDGEMVAIAYRTMKAGEVWTYRHAFTHPLPRLTFDDDGQAFIDRGGSRYRVTWRGIIR